jgi:hypothetical protein
VPMHGHASTASRHQIRENAVLWSDFESDVVEGRYPLGRLVRSEGRCGWFETRFDEKAAIVSLIESINDETMLLARIRAVERVSNQNVAGIFEAGATRLRDTPLVYAVMEYTEENLEEVLRGRALSADETKEVAEGLINALSAIHKEHLVCGRLEAASVLAAGDTIKLRSDYLQLIPPDVVFEPYAAKDVRDLGSLLHQCLTLRPLNPSTDANDPSLQLLPAPFVQMLRRILSGQATLDELAALLQPAGATVSDPANPDRMQKPADSTRSFETTKPVTEAEREVEKLPLHKDAPRRTPLIIGFVVLLLLAGFALRAMLHRSEPAPAQNPVVVVSPEAAPRKSPPAPPLPAPAKGAAAPITASPTGASTGTWRVVAFTYNYQDQAEHKAHTINSRHSDLQASVFSPKGARAPYLVVLGTATDRASAFRLRDKAVQEGLPKDTYAQNYSQ